MFCKQCGSQIPDAAVMCVKCGVPTGAPAMQPVQPMPMGPGQVVPKTRNAYVLLGLLPGFFGFPGIHNLYAGYTAAGLVQLLGSVLTCWILWIPMYIWTIVEVATVMKDSQGNPLV